MLNYRHLSDVWSDASKHLANPPLGVQLGWWPRFNQILGGLRPHEFTLLCAPTGAGKTQLIANISAQLLMSKTPHFVAPVETGDDDFAIRVISAFEKHDYNQGDAVEQRDVMRLTEKYARMLTEYPLYISKYDNRVEMEEMLNMLKYMHQSYGVRVALLDNLNFFLKVVSSQMERAEMDSAVHEFLMLSKKLPLHIVLIVHPRKTEAGRVESEFDIKGSSTAVQEASNVLLFNRPKPDDVRDGLREPTDRELVFRKIRRRGQNVGKPIWMKYTGGRLEEYLK